MFAKNFHLHWIADRANILSKYIIQIFFNLGHGFYGSFPMLFPKALIFAALSFYIYELKKCVSDIESNFKLELMFLSFVVSFLVDTFN